MLLFKDQIWIRDGSFVNVIEIGLSTSLTATCCATVDQRKAVSRLNIIPALLNCLMYSNCFNNFNVGFRLALHTGQLVMHLASAPLWAQKGLANTQPM